MTQKETFQTAASSNLVRIHCISLSTLSLTVTFALLKLPVILRAPPSTSSLTFLTAPTFHTTSPSVSVCIYPQSFSVEAASCSQWSPLASTFTFTPSSKSLLSQSVKCTFKCLTGQLHLTFCLLKPVTSPSFPSSEFMPLPFTWSQSHS